MILGIDFLSGCLRISQASGWTWMADVPGHMEVLSALFIPGFFEGSTGSEGGVGYVPSSTNNKETLLTLN